MAWPVPGMSPDDKSMILRVHGREDSSDSLVALFVRQSVPGRDRNMVAGDGGPRGIPQGFHVSHGIVGIPQRHVADGDDAGGLADLLVEVLDQIPDVAACPTVPSRRDDHAGGVSWSASTARVRRSVSSQSRVKDSESTRPPT